MPFRQIISEKVKYPYWYRYKNGDQNETQETGRVYIWSDYNNPVNQNVPPSDYVLARFKLSDISSIYKSNCRIVNRDNVIVALNFITTVMGPGGYEHNRYPSAYGREAWTEDTSPETAYIDLISRDDNQYYANYGSTTVNVHKYIGVFLNIRPGNSYNGLAYFKFLDDTNEAGGPYSNLQWERCDPNITDILPGSGGFADDLHDFRIKWTMDAPESESGNVFLPTDIQFLWGTTEALGNTITLTLDPENIETYQGVTIPANTFPSNGTVYWKIRWKSALEDTYWETQIGTYSTTDGEAVVRPISPVNSSIDGETDNVFTWEYSNSTGLNQFAFDFEYSNNDGLSWENLFSHQESANTFCTVPSGTFIAGNGLWRVRGYNTDDVAGEWSEIAQIIVRASPLPPVILSASTTPRVTITWQSNGQQAYRITAGDFDSGVIFGTGKIYTIPFYFPDGNLKISIIVQNRFGIWSNPGTTSVVIKNTSGETVLLSGSVSNFSGTLGWNTEGSYKAYYVVRDNIPVACVENKNYTDPMLNGESEYKIMAVTSDGNYTYSNSVTLTSLPEHALLAQTGQNNWINLRVRRGGMPGIRENFSEDIYYQFYSGRYYPIAYSANFRTRTKSFEFTVSKEDAQKIADLIGKSCIVKDYAGNKSIGILNNIQFSGYTNRPDVNFDLTVIDYTEEVNYDV